MPGSPPSRASTRVGPATGRSADVGAASRRRLRAIARARFGPWARDRRPPPSPESRAPSRAPSPGSQAPSVIYDPPMTIEPEVWLRGPVEGIPAELLPAAHAFLQTLEDVEHAAAGLTWDQLWRTPGGAPSVGFHLRHLDGSTDRLLTYARGERLSADQKAALAGEQAASGIDAGGLLANVRSRIASALDALRATPAATIYEPRAVGRAALPTAVI